MLVLHSTSRCDVCLLEYTWETSAKAPHAIACGHIFCRDCLYATTPPLCPLCRKQYQPAKIKKLHVDRPENVDEAREGELRRQQLELLEKLVEVWDIEVPASEEEESDEEEEDPNRTFTGLPEHDPRDELDSLALAGPSERRVRILAATQTVPDGDEDDADEEEDHVAELSGSRRVEHILDRITGEPGTGRELIERLGSSSFGLSHGHIMTLKEAQADRLHDVLRQVDIWIEKQEAGSCDALHKSRLLFDRHIEMRGTMQELLSRMQTLAEDKEEMVRLKQEERKTAREELERYVGLVEELTRDAQLRNKLASKRAERSERHHRSNMSSPSLRNPLPPPPEPISLGHLPTFAQAVSEASGSVYSPGGSILGTSSMGVRFSELAPSPPPRSRERYAIEEESPSLLASPTRRDKKKSKSKGSPYSNNYRDDSGYEEDTHHRQASSSSVVYPISAPPGVGGFTLGHAASNSAIYSTHSGTVALPSASTSQAVYHSTQQPSYDQTQYHGIYTPSYASRSSGLQNEFERTSQPLDVFTMTSSLVKEYSAGFINGQEAALGVGKLVHPPPSLSRAPYSAPAITSRERHRREDTSDSIIYTAESEEVMDRDDLGRGSGARSRSQSRSRTAVQNQNQGQISNPLLAGILSDGAGPSRRQLSNVSLPSTSSHGHPSPAASILSSSHNHHGPAILVSNSSNVSSSNALGLESTSSRSSRSYEPSVASSSNHGAPPPLPDDPAAAQAMISDNLAAAGLVYSPSVRSYHSRTTESWGTVYSNLNSNSLITGLRGLPNGDNGSVRTRGTREQRASITSFSSFVPPASLSGSASGFNDAGGEVVREERRDSRGSELGSRGGRSDAGHGAVSRRDTSPVRPVQTMVGVLPIEEDSPQHVAEVVPPSFTSPTNRARSQITPNQNPYRSSTAMDRRMASNSTVVPGTYGDHYSNSPTPNQSQVVAQSSQNQGQGQPTEAQRIAASTGWSSSTTLNHSSSSGTMAGYYTEVEREPASSSRRNRDRERRERHERRDRARQEEEGGRDAYQRPTTHRSQTSMGVSSAHSTHSGSGSWLWNPDSDVYPSPRPMSRSSQRPNATSEQIPPNQSTAQSSDALSGPQSTSNSSARSHQRERMSRHRSHEHTHSYSSSRPSLLGIQVESNSPFPISVESTDDERYPGGHGYGSRSSGGGGGRSARNAGHDDRSATSGGMTTHVEEPDQPLQSFGNALGLDLITTSNGISAPTPIASHNSFLRTWSDSSQHR